jgi:hypothetical protein
MANLKEQLLAFREGKYLNSEGKESWCFNFWDWFCKSKSLKAKADRLFKLTERFVRAMNVDLEKHYVFFKNNCPMFGPLYDDLRICSIDEGKVIWNLTPKSGHSGKAELWGASNDFKEPIATADNATELLKMIH